MTKGLLTKFSVYEIQDAIRNSLAYRRVCLRNVAWGFFKNIEVDFLTESDVGYLTDWEIKRSREDFLADFKKKHFHDDIRIKNLIYVLPDVMAGDWLRGWCEENYKTFKRHFTFRFYTSDGDVCRLHDEFKIETQNMGGYGYKRIRQPTKYHASMYINDDMMVDIIANDRLYDYHRPLFLEEKVKLYRLAIIKGEAK